jgi:hypothetical protein
MEKDSAGMRMAFEVASVKANTDSVWARPVSDPTGPALTDGAFKSKLGLPLQSTKAPITVIVIESAARSSSAPGTAVTLPFVWPGKAGGAFHLYGHRRNNWA